MGWLNVGSLVLGLIAWILPIVNLTSYDKHNNRNWIVLSIMSISACAIALCFQIIYNNHLVKIEDWSALMDTSGAVASVSAVLLIVTFLLNSFTMLVHRAKQ
ncbi:TMEM128 family protein [Bacillus dakarensis]|uniref:TMEM128 family protein n=1 Tax=Robertmurraya dakarensis TaxID=1926278 RepID=UPI000980E4A7|nr:TMEM128 family protein [Bacillus dakarensis]